MAPSQPPYKPPCPPFFGIEEKVKLLAQQLHKLPEQNQPFALSLVTFYDKYQYMSEKQYYWVIKLLQRLDPPK